MFIINSIFGVNVRVGLQIYVFKVKSYIGRQELLRKFKNFNFKKFVLNTNSLLLVYVYIFRVYVKLAIFLMLQVELKKVVEELSFNKLNNNK